MTYDEWKLSTPWDDVVELGVEDGQTCNRVSEPDEGAPKGYKPKPCQGEMVEDDGFAVCDCCGAFVQVMPSHALLKRHNGEK